MAPRRCIFKVTFTHVPDAAIIRPTGRLSEWTQRQFLRNSKSTKTNGLPSMNLKRRSSAWAMMRLKQQKTLSAMAIKKQFFSKYLRSTLPLSHWHEISIYGYSQPSRSSETVSKTLSHRPSDQWRQTQGCNLPC